MNSEPDATDEAIAHWRRLAADERRRPSWDRYALPEICETRSRMYERTAESLELTKRTGVWHCACCLQPGCLPGIDERTLRR